VFLHALLPAATGRSIEEVALDLTRQLPMRVIGVDAPGFGQSPPSSEPDYALDHLAALLAATAREAGTPYVLAGHSWGAALAVRIAATQPHAVRGLVLLDGGHFDHAALPDADTGQTVADTIAEMDDIGWRFVEHPPPLPRAWLAGLQRVGDGRWESTASPRAAGAAMNHLMRATTSEHYPVLAAAGTPILLLTATEPEQRRRDNEERTARLLSALPHARAEALSGSGHDLLADAPGQVADAIARWWRDIDCHHVRMAGHTFIGVLWEHEPDSPGSWHFITLPLDVADDVLAETGPRHGFGSVRVHARIGDTTWPTSLFPDSSSGSLLLPVKKQVRQAERLEPGSSCQVTLHPIT
jgi:pimeloyl-ACP methyl ester carboxylesterase